MTNELRHRLQRELDRLDVDAPPFEAIAQRSAAEGRRRQLASALTAAVVVGAVVLGTYLLRPAHTARRLAVASGGITQPGTTIDPAKVIVLRGGALEVVSAADGTIVDTVTTDAQDLVVESGATLDSARHVVYVVKAAANPSPGCRAPVPSIVGLPISSSVSGPHVAGPGQYPVVSPDNHYLAYLTTTAAPCDLQHSPLDELVLVSLTDGSTTKWDTSAVSLRYLSWSPDSKSLMAWTSTSCDASCVVAPVELPVIGTLGEPIATNPFAAARAPHVPADTTWAGWLTDSDHYLAYRTNAPPAPGVPNAATAPPYGPPDSSTTFEEIDAVTGAVTRTLFGLDCPPQTSNVSDGPERSVMVDQVSGQVLVRGTSLSNGQCIERSLYRWNASDNPTTLAWATQDEVPLLWTSAKM